LPGTNYAVTFADIVWRIETMQREQFLIHQSALTVRNFLELERDLGQSPTWEEFVGVSGTVPSSYVLDVRLILRDLWRRVVVPELARIIQYFDEELLREKFYADLYTMGAHIACEMKKISTTPLTARTVLDGSTGPYGLIGLVEQAGPSYDELTVTEKKRLEQDLTSFLCDLAEQAVIECSAGLENADGNVNNDIPF